MTRFFNIELKCGCLIAEDTGTPEDPHGDGGMIPCYAKYGDMSKEEDRKALELHNKCMDEYFGKAKNSKKAKEDHLENTDLIIITHRGNFVDVYSKRLKKFLNCKEHDTHFDGKFDPKKVKR
jgi:hypothetical protein